MSHVKSQEKFEFYLKGGDEKMGRRRGSSSKGRSFPKEVVQKVWEKAKPVRSKSPDLYRRDAAGNLIYGPSYGKNSDMGWEVDHKKPTSKDGKDNLGNLQPLQSEENKEKGNEYPWKP